RSPTPGTRPAPAPARPPPAVRPLWTEGPRTAGRGRDPGLLGRDPGRLPPGQRRRRPPLSPRILPTIANVLPTVTGPTKPPEAHIVGRISTDRRTCACRYVRS